MPWDPFAVFPKWRWPLWAGLAALACASLGPVFVGLFHRTTQEAIQADFFQDWASARNVFEGLPVYSNHAITIERYCGYRPEGLYIEVNAHPPTAVLLVLPLAALRLPDALLVWNLLSLAALFVSLFLVARHLTIRVSYLSLFPGIFLLSVCFPLLQQLYYGQWTLVLLMLLTAVWAADRSDRTILAGVSLGLATAIKLFPGIFFLYFALRRRWAVLVAGGISFFLTLCLTALVLGTSTYIDYHERILPRMDKFLNSWANASLPGLWQKLFIPGTSVFFKISPLLHSPLIARTGTAASCGVILLSLVVLLRRHANTRPEQDLTFALTLTAMLLISPVTWDHYLLFLLLPLAVIWQRLPDTVFAKTLFAALLLIFWAPPGVLYTCFIPGGYEDGVATVGHTVTILSFQCYALLALFCFGAWVLQHSPASAVTASAAPGLPVAAQGISENLCEYNERHLPPPPVPREKCNV